MFVCTVMCVILNIGVYCMYLGVGVCVYLMYLGVCAGVRGGVYCDV